MIFSNFMLFLRLCLYIYDRCDAAETHRYWFELPPEKCRRRRRANLYNNDCIFYA